MRYLDLNFAASSRCKRQDSFGQLTFRMCSIDEWQLVLTYGHVEAFSKLLKRFMLECSARAASYAAKHTAWPLRVTAPQPRFAARNALAE